MSERRYEEASFEWFGQSFNIPLEEESRQWNFPATPSTPYQNPYMNPSGLPTTPSLGRFPMPSHAERRASTEYVWIPQNPADHYNNIRNAAPVPSMVPNFVPIESTLAPERPNSPLTEGPASSPPSSPDSSPISSPMPPKKRKTPVKPENRKKSGDVPQMEPIPRASSRMKSFSQAQVSDWKHVLYNLLVESHNSEDGTATLVSPVEVMHCGQRRQGFSFNPNMQPRKRIAELYAHHVRKETLSEQDPKSNFTEDLYKYYLRCAYQLMCKYFMKVGPFTYVYEEVPLFIAGESLADAEDRLRNIDTKHRRKKKRALLQG